MKPTGLSIGNAIAIGTLFLTSLGWGINQYMQVNLSWIAFIDAEGKPTFFLDRDQETGAVK